MTSQKDERKKKPRYKSDEEIVNLIRKGDSAYKPDKDIIMKVKEAKQERKKENP